MRVATGYRLGPEFTPPVIKYLITYTSIISIFCALTQNLFHRTLGTYGLQELLSLSWWGIGEYFYWQFVSFLFVSDAGFYGISFIFIISLLFNMYILWTVGSQIVEHVETYSFLRFYFTTGILAGVVALLMTRHEFIASPTPVILALLTVWGMLYPDLEILLFFLIPIKVKWLVIGMIALILLISLSQLEFVSAVFYLTGMITGYLYATISWGFYSPFPFTYSFDRKLHHFGNRIKNFTKRIFHSGTKQKSESKIFDIRSGKAIEDEEAFLDSMLEKISEHGEESLTWRERKKMIEITKKLKKGTDENSGQ